LLRRGEDSNLRRRNDLAGVKRSPQERPLQ